MMKKIIQFTPLLAVFLILSSIVYAGTYYKTPESQPIVSSQSEQSIVLGDGNINPLDQFTATTSPVSAITQRTYGKALKITGLSTGLCLTLTSQGILTTTTCGSGSAGSGNVATSTAETAGQVAVWTSTNGTPATLGSYSTLYFDSTNHTLGIGATASIVDGLYVKGFTGIASTTPWGLLSVNPNGIASGAPLFVIGSSTATKLIVDKSGNLGIGTVSPAGLLDVNSKLVVLSNGNVGIGTTGPADKLVVAGTNSNGLTLSGTNSTITSNDNLINVATSNIYLRPGASYRVNIDTGLGLNVTSGNVGIGTTAPGTNLHVAGAGTAGLQLYLGTNGTNAGGLKLWGTSANQEGNIYNDATYGLHLDTNSNGRPIRIDGSSLILGMSGNVGIATTSPGSLLGIGGSGVGINFSLASTTYSTTGGINLTKGGCFAISGVCLGSGTGTVTSVGLSSTGSITYGSTPVTTSGTITGNLNMANPNSWTALQSFANASSTLFSVNGQAWFGGTATTTITSSGKIGVGTSTPAVAVDVKGAVVSEESPVSFSATPTFDWSTSNQIEMTLTSNVTAITFSNGQRGGAYRLVLCQDGTGSRTVAGWPASILWSGGTAPTMTATANKCDVYTFTATYATTTSLVYLGGYVQNF